jgi:hypothetical protein
LGKVGEFAPGHESCRELFAMEWGAQQMTLERDVLPDRPEAREKLLCAFRVAKTTHSPLAFACRLVAVLGPVVQSGGRFDEHVLHVRKFRVFSICRRIAAQPISDDLAGHRAQEQRNIFLFLYDKDCALNIIELARDAGLLVVLDGRIGSTEYRSVHGTFDAFQRFVHALQSASVKGETCAKALAVEVR